MIETVKQAEDGNGIVVRLYETQRKRSSVVLTTGFPVASAQRTNLLEETKHEVQVEGEKVFYDIKPFEIVTLRIVPA